MHFPRYIFQIPAFTLAFSVMVMDCYAEQSSPECLEQLFQKQQNQKEYTKYLAETF